MYTLVKNLPDTGKMFINYPQAGRNLQEFLFNKGYYWIKNAQIIQTIHELIIFWGIDKSGEKYISVLPFESYHSLHRFDDHFKRSSQVKTLYLNLKGKWFNMILSGIKKEEYRAGLYWAKRLFTRDDSMAPIKYDIICFRNGYTKNAQEMTFEYNSFLMKEGNPHWGAEPGVEYFTFPLTDILSTKNIKK